MSRPDAQPEVPQREETPGASRRGEETRAPEQTRRQDPPIRLTGRGAVLVMLAVFATGLLAAAWLGWPVLAGLSFVIGTTAAAWFARRADLLTAVVSPPLLFCVALVGVKAGTASGNVALSAAEGAVITLAGAAPWLFAGTALSVAIAWGRGLRECVRELRQDRQPGHRRPGPAGPRSGPAG